ncbi:MAG TPA: hypothetical protein VKU00_29920 [Chthonomonadaceae bacterium]|nr:hypothetical protein [Chthonomonadaceae bacterium]
MDDILTHIYNACDPLHPAEPDQYVDLTDVRGGAVFVHDIIGEIGDSRQNQLPDGKFVRKLFTGHSGCGKSSELEHLALELKSKQPTFPHERYFPILINVLEHVDVLDASLPEILLAVVTETAQRLREEEGIELRSSYLEKRWAEIKKLLFADVDIKKLEIPLWSAKVELNLKLADPSSREKVRNALLPHMTRIIEEINLVLEQARSELRAHRPKDGGRVFEDLVLILDNMEKIQRATGHEMGEDSYRALFLEGASQLTALNAQTIYTIPLSLVRGVGPELSNAYGCFAFVLPNVKTETRSNHARWKPGRDKLIELLRCRALPYGIDNVLTSEAVEYLLDYCGGHVRQLMRFVRQARLRATQAPIDLNAARQAVAQSVQEFASIRPNQWVLLAELEASEEQYWDNNEEDHRQLLDMLCVLEYMNGDPTQDILNQYMPWYAVHPIIRELNQFKHAVANIKKSTQ